MEETFSHECDCSEETYWSSVALDEEFNTRLFIDELGFESWSVRRLDETEDEIRRVVEGVPKLARVPEPFRRFLKHGLAFRETDVYDKKARICHVVVRPRSMSRRITISAKVDTQPIGPYRCRCLFTIRVVATVAASLGGTSSSGVGRMVEKGIVDHFMEGFVARGDLTQRFLEEKGLSTRVARPAPEAK